MIFDSWWIINDEESQELINSFSLKKLILDDMDPHSALGSNGMHVVFCIEYWDQVKEVML